jgi:hypothetical protein
MSERERGTDETEERESYFHLLLLEDRVVSRGQNGKPTGGVSCFAKPLHAWRATSGHQPRFQITDVEHHTDRPSASTFVLSHCDLHAGPTPTPVLVRPRLEVCTRR